jgi:hypothetical protein
MRIIIGLTYVPYRALLVPYCQSSNSIQFKQLTCNRIFFSFLGQSAPGNTPKAGRFTIVFWREKW